MEQLFLSRPEAAKALNISVDTLDVLSSAGHIQKIKIGARTLYDVMGIRNFAEEAKRKGAIQLVK